MTREQKRAFWNRAEQLFGLTEDDVTPAGSAAETQREEAKDGRPARRRSGFRP